MGMGFVASGATYRLPGAGAFGKIDRPTRATGTVVARSAWTVFGSSASGGCGGGGSVAVRNGRTS